MYHFIVNPHARTGQGGKVWKVIEEELIKRDVEYVVYFTEHVYHATEITKSLTFAGIQRTIIVVGGDGTVNEVVNGLINIENVVLGYIPAGSSNDLSRALKISSDPVVALDNVLQPKYISTMDIGEITYGYNKRRFIVSAGIGFDAAICHKAFKSELKKKLNKIKLGKLTYLGIGAGELFKRKPFKTTIVLDDARRVSFNKTLFAAVQNNKYEGGGFMFCPEASNDDGMLDVMVADSIIPARAALVLSMALKGNHTKMKGIHTYKAHNIEIITDSKQPVHLDGESCFFQSRISMKCLETKVKFMTPIQNN